MSAVEECPGLVCPTPSVPGGTPSKGVKTITLRSLKVYTRGARSSPAFFCMNDSDVLTGQASRAQELWEIRARWLSCPLSLSLIVLMVSMDVKQY